MPVVSGTQYATQANLAQLGIMPAAFSTINSATLDAALLSASAIADSYLESRYTLPLVTWGQDLVRIICIIASYDLLTVRGYGVQQGVDDNIRKRYLDALAWLDEVGKGTQTPSHVADSSTDTSTGPSIGLIGNDGSVNTATQGGFQLETSQVRGWTSRGGNAGDGSNW